MLFSIGDCHLLTPKWYGDGRRRLRGTQKHANGRGDNLRSSNRLLKHGFCELFVTGKVHGLPKVSDKPPLYGRGLYNLRTPTGRRGARRKS